MAFYNDIFVGDQEFDIKKFNKYMFNNDLLKTVHSNEQVKPTLIEEQEEKNSDDFYPDNRDSLFWCIYISIYGMEEYKQIVRGFDNIVINEKQKIGNYFEKNYRLLQNIEGIKITQKEAKEMLADIMTNSIVNPKLLYAFAIYYKKRILITRDEFYIDIKPFEYEGTIVLIKNKQEYGINMSVELQKITDEFFKLQTYEKPLKALSSYTKTELQEWIEYFDLKIDKKADKRIMYNELNSFCKF
tara:strand:- start:1180 stop:1908 length:729 start_codon:yes stop_codon:yes gene_type:complete